METCMNRESGLQGKIFPSAVAGHYWSCLRKFDAQVDPMYSGDSVNELGFS
jgi:hypothetical protein